MDFNSVISIFLILFINLTYEQDANSFEVREHSLSRPYPSVFSTSKSYWHLSGNTLATDRYIRLTADAQSKSGGLWNMIPISYPDWEIHINFKVHGEGKTFFGDGLAIWYVKDPILTGPVFGYRDYFTGLGIIMDTYSNQIKTTSAHHHTFPYISAIINNGSLHYDQDRDGENIILAGCESSFRSLHVDTIVAIRYQNDRLTISTDIEGNNVWKECFSIDNVHLPTYYHLGFSAATGQLSDNHDIISVHTYQLDSTEQRRTEDRKNIIPSAILTKTEDATIANSQTTGWSALKIFFIVVLIIIIGLGAIGAYYYTQNHRYHRSRFY